MENKYKLVLGGWEKQCELMNEELWGRKYYSVGSWIMSTRYFGLLKFTKYVK